MLFLASPRIIKHAAHVLGRTPFLGSFLSRSVGHPRTSIPHGLTSHIRLMSNNIDSNNSNILWERMSKEVSRWENVPANPYSGRSVSVSRDLADAFKRLDTILGRNKVRAQVLQSERHEQKGAKRRRLSSERWRKRFAHEVHLKVQLVQKIRRRGA